MSSQESIFAIFDPSTERNGSERLKHRRVPECLGTLEESAKDFLPSKALVDALNTALAVGAPLLVTGEPGTGKTQVAFWAAWKLGIDGGPLTLDVNSQTRRRDLLYAFDQVAYFQSREPGRGLPPDKKKFLTKGPLWRAFDLGRPSVVLIDEIDKAPRDFPNDLLNTLDQHRFRVPELDTEEAPCTISGKPDQPPLVVITSNSEKRLPEPFLRRSIFHHISFDQELIRKIVERRLSGSSSLSEVFRAKGIERFLEIREIPELRKKPATAELLVWFAVLGARGITEPERLEVPLGELPSLACLIKDGSDLALLPRKI